MGWEEEMDYERIRHGYRKKNTRIVFGTNKWTTKRKKWAEVSGCGRSRELGIKNCFQDLEFGDFFGSSIQFGQFD